MQFAVAARSRNGGLFSDFDQFRGIRVVKLLGPLLCGVICAIGHLAIIKGCDGGAVVCLVVIVSFAIGFADGHWSKD